MTAKRQKDYAKVLRLGDDSAIEQPSRKYFSYEECLRLGDNSEKQEPSWKQSSAAGIFTSRRKIRYSRLILVLVSPV